MELCSSRIVISIVIALLVACSHAFVPTPTPRGPRRANRRGTAELSMTAGVSRAEAIRRAGLAVLAGGGALAQIAAAETDVEEDLEQEQFMELRTAQENKKKAELIKENAPLIADATAGLKTLDSFITEKDYISIRSAMRRPPINQLRLSASAVISNLSDEARKAKVDKAYKALISSVEELDRVASLGVKNGLKDDKSITAAYEKCVEQGNALVGALP